MMTITLNLQDEVEQRLRIRAAIAGKSLPDFLQEITREAAFSETRLDMQAADILTAAVAPEKQADVPIDEWIRGFKNIAASAPSAPILSSEATRRSAIYDED